MRYGDTKRGKRNRAGKKHRLNVSTADTFSGSACNMSSAGQGASSIYDPWLCGRPFHGQWDGDNTQVEIVTAGLTELSRIGPWSSGAALPPVLTRRQKPNVPLYDQVG